MLNLDPITNFVITHWDSLLIGLFGGWLLQRISELKSGPNFKIELGTTPSLLSGTPLEVKFINVQATNLKRNFLFQILSNNSTANNARAWIIFLDPITNAELLKINGRWTSTKEPIDYRGGVNIGDALITSRETIPPGEMSELSIAVKENGKDECYGFNNESYLVAGTGMWSKPEFALDQKRYIVEVKIAAEGKEWSKEFVLLNLGKTLRNFKLLINNEK